MRFKEGDRVEVVDAHEDDGRPYIGHQGVITEVRQGRDAPYHVDGAGWWKGSEIERVEELEKNPDLRRQLTS